MRLAPATRRAIDRILVLAAIGGFGIGINALILHLTMDPLADVHAYYDAATRLNNGIPLYEQDIAGSTGLYLYPPLLAILFRPLALLPFELAAVIWEGVVVVAFLLTLRRIGIRRNVVLALGMLAMPILWTLSIGQAETLVTLMLAIGSPAAVAVAGNIKLAPILVAVYWLGRRDWRSIRQLAVWILALVALQFILEPAGTIAYARAGWLGAAFEVRNISPYAVSPLLWIAMVAVLGLLAFRYAPTRWGWPFAVALAVFVYPRLLAYQLMTLLAAFGGPRGRSGEH